MEKRLEHWSFSVGNAEHFASDVKNMQPFFLDLDHVLQIHRSLIETYGGIEGVRDIGLLHSAIAMPQASFGGEFLHNDLLEMAAAYLYHITLFWMAINELARLPQSSSWQ